MEQVKGKLRQKKTRKNICCTRVQRRTGRLLKALLKEMFLEATLRGFFFQFFLALGSQKTDFYLKKIG